MLPLIDVAIKNNFSVIVFNPNMRRVNDVLTQALKIL
jgi:hypothetical protein